MTLWARNDVQSITVGEAHGGCGQVHRRAEGETAFPVTCFQCEDFLRTDKNWSAQPEAVPETPDEVLHREATEKAIGSRQVAHLDQMGALLSLLGGPSSILSGGVQPGALPAGTAACRKCSASVAPSARFCGTCGTAQLRQIEGAASA